MPDVNQLNLRIPTDAFDTVRDLAKVLRTDPQFRHQLQRLLDERGDPDVAATLGQRLDRLEKQVAELVRRERPLRPKEALRASSEVDRCEKTPSMFGSAMEETGNTLKWTNGEGRARRLTMEGKQEADRLIEAGGTDAEIAKTLGVKPNTVTNRRKSRTAV